MKKRGLLIVLSTIMLASCSAMDEKAYNEKIQELQYKLSVLGYPVLINAFEESKGWFPSSLCELYSTYEEEVPEIIGNMEKVYFIDIFSKTGDWIGYYPIWDDSDSVILSYILVSAGIDGKMDHIPAPGVKLHMNDWMDSFEFYNPNECEGMIRTDTITVDERPYMGGLKQIPKYKAKEARNGKKDMLVYANHLVDGDYFRNIQLE